VATAVLRAADAAYQFVVLSVGDEELAPLNAVPAPSGPMLPIGDFAAQIGALFSFDKGTIALTLNADERVSATLTIGSQRGTRVNGAQTTPIRLADASVVERDGEWFATVDALRAMTGLELNFDARSQTVAILSPRSALPRYAGAMRRAVRVDRSLDAGDLMAPLRPSPMARVASSSLLPHNASLTYSLSQDNTTGFVSGQGTLGAAVLGGGLSVTGNFTNGNQRRNGSPDVTWLGGNPLSKWLTQARVGWGAATGLAPWSGFGISLTNAPFSRAISLGSVPLTGNATPGAEIEIQSAGRLLGVVTADESGRWNAQVPVGFGQNLLDIATYGPRGVTRRNVLHSLEGDHLPRGKVEYGVTAQRSHRDAVTCTFIGCGDMGNADVRWGISPRITVRAGASALRSTDSTKSTITASPYATLVAAPLSWLQLRQEVAGTNWFRTRAVVQPSLGLRADVGYETLKPNAGAMPFWLLNRASSTRAESFISATWRPFNNDLGRMWVSMLGRATRGTRNDSRLTSMTVGGRAFGSLVTLGADQTVITPIGIGSPYDRARFSTSVTIPQLRRGPRWLATSFATIGASASPSDAYRPNVSAGLTSTLFENLLMQVGTDWRPGAAPGVRLSFQHHSKSAIVMQTVGSGSIGTADISATTSVLGSVLLPLDGGAPSLTSDLVALRARVRVIAFFDADADGLSDPSEAFVPDLSVLVGTQRSTTNASGIAIVDGLPVLDAVMVKPEELYVNGDDGSVWVLEGPAPWARLVPYGETDVPLPFVLSAQPTMLLDDESAGVTAWIISLDNSAAPPMLKRFFADRSAPLGPLAPGRYRIEARSDAAPTAPTAMCTTEFKSGENARLRFPPGLDHTSRCLIDAGPSAP
jgi:hypothetical protein